MAPGSSASCSARPSARTTSATTPPPSGIGVRRKLTPTPAYEQFCCGGMCSGVKGCATDVCCHIVRSFLRRAKLQSPSAAVFFQEVIGAFDICRQVVTDAMMLPSPRAFEIPYGAGVLLFFPDHP